MVHRPPRSDDSPTNPGSDAPARPSVTGRCRRLDRRAGPPGRGAIEAAEVDRAASRTYWEAEADAYQAEHGAFLAGAGVRVVDSADEMGATDYADGLGALGAGFVWGPEGLDEAEAGLLGPVDLLGGQLVLEVGCGAAQCSRWLADRGAHAVGLDIATAQLRHARGAVPVVAGTGVALPFRDHAFDAAFSSYGAVQFVADLDVLFAEVARVLRPGGRWVFSATHPIRWAFPDEPGAEGLSASGSYFDRSPYVEVDVPGGPAVYAEFHRTIGDYVSALRLAGFSIDTDRRARVAGVERAELGRLEPTAWTTSARHPDHRVPGRWCERCSRFD